MQKIDWKNLSFLPDKKHKDQLDRERLADKKYQRTRAKHKGRCHLSNQKRRQQSLNLAEKRAKEKKIRDGMFSKYNDAVRAYWLGLTQCHPKKPI